MLKFSASLKAKINLSLKRRTQRTETKKNSAEIFQAFQKYQVPDLNGPSGAALPLPGLKPVLYGVFFTLFIILSYQFVRTGALKRVFNAALEKKDALREAVPGTAVSEKADKKRALFSEWEYLFYAEKASKTLRLLRLYPDNSYSTEKVYKQIGTGERNGRKRERGDLKTPLGVYWVIEYKSGEELPAIYGAMAYVLNYPNEADREAGRTGSGIWIHGVETGKKPETTKGCLEVTNENLRELYGIIGKGIGTPVIITENRLPDSAFIQSVFSYNRIRSIKNRIVDASHQERVLLENLSKPDSSTYRQITGEIRKLVEKWRSAWESKMLEGYASCYNRDVFKWRGMSFDDWETRKRGIFRAADSISVKIEDIRFSYVGERVAKLSFIQNYRSPTFSQVSRKYMVVANELDGWKIINEGGRPD
ncbi:MAG: L,D-transpeptidase family protein [Fibrobacterota bacterium]